MLDILQCFSWVLLKKYSMCLLLFSISLFAFSLPSDSVNDQANNMKPEAFPDGTFFRIRDVEYDIKGMTIEALLQRAVPINTAKKFKSQTEFLNYLKALKSNFENIRTLEYVQIDPIYDKPNSDGLSLVHLIIHTKDSFNFIMLPYPKYDSNSGFLLKLKAKDNNFLGTMEPFNFDLNYHSGDSKSISLNCNFNYPYVAGPFFASQTFNTGFNAGITDKDNTSFTFVTTSSFSYHYKFIAINFGLSQSFKLNKYFGANIGKKNFKYSLNTGPFFSLPITITQVGNFGHLVYTPSFSFNKDWTFSSETNSNIKGVNINAGHSLSFGKVSWNKNFREGLKFSISNNYLYNTFKKGKPNISISTTLTGYISFLNRFALYGRGHFFYNFNNVKSTVAGEKLRGILNRRIYSDMAFSFNIDMPIKIFDFNFTEITDKSWTRVFGFEMQFAPFLDFAFTHDPKTDKYFSHKDAWCSGGFEIIVYPHKMRSIYVRASLGFDLLELKNVPGLIKLKGKAKRDGLPISEIFIGIGLHY